MKMYDLRFMLNDDPPQVAARFPASICRIRQGFKRDVRQIEKAAHLARRFGEKTEDALPALLSQLQRQLARKHFCATDTPWRNAEHRHECSVATRGRAVC